MITVARYHDISCGHRVVGHESKCAFLHGHNYRITFTCRAEELDNVGRVLDFSVMKSKLCMWLENNWDHKFLAWEHDAFFETLYKTLRFGAGYGKEFDLFHESIVWMPFNPTAENMADYLLRVISPIQLRGTGVEVIDVRVDETRKCSASASLL